MFVELRKAFKTLSFIILKKKKTKQNLQSIPWINAQVFSSQFAMKWIKPLMSFEFPPLKKKKANSKYATFRVSYKNCHAAMSKNEVLRRFSGYLFCN